MTFLFSRHSFLVLFAFSIPAFAGSPAPGIKNFHQVDAHVYRGAQPSEEGFRYLAKIGVSTVIDLCEADERSIEEKALVTAAGMKYINVPMTGLTPPTQTEIARILALLEDNSPGPVFVHCKRGADRTGAVVASYRIDHDRWDSGHALEEAMSLGMSFFQLPRQNYIRDFRPLGIESSHTAASTSLAAAPSVSNSAIPQL